MRVKSQKSKTIKQQIIELLETSLPKIYDTKMANHLHKVYAPKFGKGKLVNFQWKKREFRVSENLKVKEYAFGSTNRKCLIENNDTKELEEILKNNFLTN